MLRFELRLTSKYSVSRAQLWIMISFFEHGVGAEVNDWTLTEDQCFEQLGKLQSKGNDASVLERMAQSVLMEGYCMLSGLV